MRRRPDPGASLALVLVVAVLAVAVLSGGVPTVVAQSTGSPALPSPATSTPHASPRSDACVGRSDLPAVLDGRPLQVSFSGGVAAIDPDDLLDPLLGVLGRTRADVCVVTVRYADGSDMRTGQLIRIAGSDASDLAERLAATIGDRLADLGAQASASPIVLDASVVWTLDIVAGAQTTRLLFGQAGDTLLVASDPVAMRQLLPLLGAAPSPSPSASITPVSPSG